MDFATDFMKSFLNSGGRRAPPGEQWDYAPSYGAFVPTYLPSLRTPKTNEEAQSLYNHSRTAAYYMDSLPFVSQMGFPVKIGIDDIISAIPIWGDLIGFFMSLYQVFLAWVFGVPTTIISRMLINVVIDFFVGVVPIIGDFLDVLFKANLRNLALLEEWLIKDAKHYRIFIPPSDVFLPRAPKGTGAWNRAAGDKDPRDKYRNPPKTTRMRPADLD